MSRRAQMARRFISLSTLVVALAASLAMNVVTAWSAGLVDLNTADQKTLEALPGVGPSVAKEIIAGRPYKTVDELSRAKGIGKAKLDAIRSLVTVGGAKVVQPLNVPSVPATAAVPPKALPAAPAVPAVRQKASAAAQQAAGQVVNINTASKAAIEALPGIGSVKAQAIIDGRPYSKPEDIMKIKGIKEGIYKKIQGLITVR